MSFGKAFSGIKNIAGIGLAPSTGGASILGTKYGSSFKDLFLGKKSDPIKDRFTPLDPLQERALSIYDKQLSNFEGVDPAQMARNEIAQKENQILASANDQERQAKDLVAQRGLNTSSVGLNAILGAKRDLNDRIIQSRSMLPLLQNQYQNEQINRLNSISGGIGNILNQRAFIQGNPGGVRGGGLLAPLLGIGGAGAAIAGNRPELAPSAYQAGTGLGNAFSNR